MQPEKPEDISAITGVAALLWELDQGSRPEHSSFSSAQAAGSTSRYDYFAVELWRRGWLDTVAIVSDVGGPNSA